MGTNWKVSVVMMALRWNAARCRLAACLALALVLTGCTGDVTVPPLTELRLPGVRKVAELATFQHDRQIAGVAAFTDPVSSKTRIVFQADQLYTIGLDGRDLRAIKDSPTCVGPLSVSSDDRWVACDEHTGVYAFALDPDAALKSFLLLRDTHPDSVFDPIWSPDGNMFAVIDRSPSAGCAVELYRSPLKRPDVPPIATLTFPTFMGASGRGCYLKEIAWSRDGAWLALVANDAVRNPELSVYVFSLDNLPLLAENPVNASVGVTVAQNDLVRVGEAHGSTRIAWSNQGAHQLLTMVEQNLLSIGQIEPPAGTRTPLFKIPSTGDSKVQNYGFVCSLAWAPDGARLIFVDCAPGNIEVPAVPSKLYVYTPPGA